MTNIDDRRKHQRFPCIGVIKIYWLKGFFPALIAESSYGGSRIFSLEPVPVGSEIRLVVPEDQGEEVSVYGRIVWQKKTLPFRDIGLYLDYVHGIQYMATSKYFLQRIVDKMSLV